MANKPDRVIALMSIHPRFASLILEGKKKVEFRKTRFASDVSHIIIYATVPVQKVVGFFTVSGIVEADPNELWALYQHVGGVDRDFYDQYYESKKRAIAIEVDDPRTLSSPVDLASLGISGPPPQSFRYVPHQVLNEVVTYAN